MHVDGSTTWSLSVISVHWAMVVHMMPFACSARCARTYVLLGVARQTNRQILGAAGPGSRYVLADWEPRPPLGPDPIVVARLGWIPRYPRWSTVPIVCTSM